MALVVEDGTGKSNANTYISQSDADSYFSSRDNPTAWTGLSSAKKDAALIYATVTLDGMWDFVGTVTTSTQSLAWPRDGVWDEEGRRIEADVSPSGSKMPNVNWRCSIPQTRSTRAMRAAELSKRRMWGRLSRSISTGLRWKLPCPSYDESSWVWVLPDSDYRATSIDRERDQYRYECTGCDQAQRDNLHAYATDGHDRWCDTVEAVWVF